MTKTVTINGCTYSSSDKGDQLSQILATQTLATVQERKLTKEESERKAAILAQYGQVSDGEEYPFPIIGINRMSMGYVSRFA